MKMSYSISSSIKEDAIDLYEKGLCAQEIRDTLQLPHHVRTIQRWVNKAGVSRTIGDAFRNAVKRGRVHFAYKENKIKRKSLLPRIRWSILQRDNFKCNICGNGAAEGVLLEVDHIDEDKNNNALDNLWTLCHECNIGKSQSKVV